MKHIVVKLQLVFLLTVMPVLYAQADTILLCGQDISHKNSPFKWELVQDMVPMYLFPNEAKNIYQQLLDDYVRNLSQDEEQLVQVKQFIDLQKAIITGKKSALLAIKAGPFSGDELLSKEDTIFAIPCEKTEESWLIDITYLAIAYKKIHDASFEQFRAQADRTIQRRNMQYQNWFDNGLPMWPQETWLNGLLLNESDAEQPARHQWVLLRPSVGIGSNTHGGISNNKLEATLGLEIAGFAHYLNDDYSKYWGLSLLTTLGDDAGVGYGVLLRYNNYVLGYTKREKDVALGIDDNNEYIFIGYDLYQLLHDKKDGFDGFKRKVRATIDNYHQ